MDKKKSVIRAGAVLVVALAAGHLVQTMNADKGLAAAENPTAVEQVSAGPEAAAKATEAAVPVNSAIPSAASLTAPAAAPAEAAAAAPAEVLPEVVVTAPATPAPDVAETPILAALPDLPGTPPTEPDPALPAIGTDLAEQPAAADTPTAPKMADLSPTDAAPATDQPAMAVADCATNLALTAGPQAMIAVSITAPCRAGQRVVLRHAGLAVAELLSDTGSLTLDFPALNAAGEVSVLFPDAEVLRDRVAVPDAATAHRFGVQWMADDAFQLHAFEKGADYGEPGDVHADAPVSPNGGYLVALGNPTLDFPMMAQVYTWPADPAVAVEVAIESVVTETTCGRELLGEVVQSQGGAVIVADLTLAMPECDAVGDILVLKNPGQDVTLAAN